MKLQRHTQARTVSELATLKPISPQEAAGEIGLKTGALMQMGEQLGRAFEGFAAVKRHRIVQESKLAAVEVGIRNKAALQNLKNDPQTLEIMKENPAYMEEEAAHIMQLTQEDISKIADPEIRARSERLFRAEQSALVTDILHDSEKKLNRLGRDKTNAGTLELVQAGLIEEAEEFFAAGSQYFDETEKVKMQGIIDEGRTTRDAQLLIDNVDEGYAISAEEGDKRLAALIANTDLDTDVRNKAIDGSEGKQIEWGKARQRGEKELELQGMRNFGEDRVVAHFGGMTFEQVDAAYESERYGDPESAGAISRRNQLYAKITEAIGRQETELNIRAMYEANQFMIDDKKHRDALSVLEQEMTEGKEPQEQLEIVGDLSRVLGTVSTQTSNLLNTGGKSLEGLLAQLPLYNEITADKTTTPTLHIAKDAEILLEDAKSLMDSGLTRQEAATVAWNNRGASELERDQRQDSWKTSGVDAANTAFKSLVDSDAYEEKGFGDVEEIPAEMEIEYGTVYRAVYMATGNEVTAQNIADRTTRQNWIMTNFNSADPDEYTIERNGLSGDTRRIRAGVIREISTEDFRVKQDDGTYADATIDPDKIQFVSTDRDEDGNRRWYIEQNGAPLSRFAEVEDPLTGETTTVLETASFVMDETQLSEYKRKTARFEETETRLREIKHETARLKNLTEKSPYRTSISALTEKRKKRIESLGEERRSLEAALPKFEVDF